MKNTSTSFIAVIISLAFVTLFNLTAAAESINKMEQRIIGNLSDKPFKEGLSGAFIGTHNNAIIVAGGTSFPELKPWQDGKKQYSNLINIYLRNNDGLLECKPSNVKLDFPIGDGAAASTPLGVVCIGGQTPENLSNQVLLISYEHGTIKLMKLPLLPQAVKAAAATAIGTNIYVIGGEGENGTVSSCYKMDIASSSAAWQQLPDFPLPISGAATVAQMDGNEVSIYVVGGRARLVNHTATTFYPYVYRYKLSSSRWEKLKDISIDKTTHINIAAASAVPIGASHIVLFGGDKGDVYTQVEVAINNMNSGNMANARNIRDSLWINHPGFNDMVLVYNTITDKWFNAGVWTGTPTALSTAVYNKGSIVLLGGELRPGVRTNEITEFNFTVKPVFGWLNYLVLVVYFIGMLLLGFFFMRKNSNTNEFFKAGGRIPWWAAGISIFATTLSAITFIAIPAKTYATDWRMFMFNMSIIMVVPIVITYFLPFFRRFNFDTAYQYLEARFNRGVRWLASSLFVLFMISRLAIVLFLPSLALNAVTGFNVYWAIIIMSLVTIAYCTTGGIEAVVWSDVIQGFILVGGALAALIFIISGVDGGWSGFWEMSTQNDKFRMIDLRLDFTQPVLWVVLLGGIANTLITYTSDQSIVQKYMTTKDENAAKRGIWLNGIISIPVTVVFFLIGTGLYAYYISNPEKMAVMNPNIDSVFPQFIVAQMPAGMSGLLIAAIFAAAMSTLSSNINSVAAVITSDFFHTTAKVKENKSSMRVARWSGVIVGLLGMGTALILATWNIASLWDQFNTFLGLLTGVLGALFIMGIFFPKISATAAIAGTVGGLAILMVVKNFTNLSFLLYGFIGLIASVIIAIIISVIIPNNKMVDTLTWKSRIKN